MSFESIIDLLGFGVIFWAIGRLCFHITLLDFDHNRVTRKTRVLYILTWIFYILGFLSSLIIGLVDAMCHKRLYHNYLTDLHRMKTFVPYNIKNREEFEKFCSDHNIGPYDSTAPMDIPFSWYTPY